MTNNIRGLRKQKSLSQQQLAERIGATGQQGGKVVDALLDAGGWKVRGFTRDANSEKAQALVARGVEIAQGDMDDVASLETAMRGAHGVYSVQSVGGRGVEVEIQEGINVADAAKKVCAQVV